MNYARLIIPTFDLSQILKSLFNPIFFSPNISLIYLHTTKAFFVGKNLLEFFG